MEIELTDLSGIRLRASAADARQETFPHWATGVVALGYINSNFPACSCTCRQEIELWKKRPFSLLRLCWPIIL